MKKKLIKNSDIREEPPSIKKPQVQVESSSEDSDQEILRQMKNTKFQIVDENEEKKGKIDQFLVQGKTQNNAPQPKKQKILEFTMIEEPCQPQQEQQIKNDTKNDDDYDSDLDFPSFDKLANITRSSATTATQQIKSESKPIQQIKPAPPIPIPEEVENHSQIEVEEDPLGDQLCGKSYHVATGLDNYTKEQISEIIQYFGGNVKVRLVQKAILVTQKPIKENSKAVQKDYENYKSPILYQKQFEAHLQRHTGFNIQQAYQQVELNKSKLKLNSSNHNQEIQEDNKTQQNLTQFAQNNTQSQKQETPKEQVYKQDEFFIKPSNLKAKFDSEVVIVEKQIDIQPEVMNLSKTKKQNEEKKTNNHEIEIIEEKKQKSQLWTTKYAPSKVSDCLDQTHVITIVKWLDNWGKNQLEIQPGSFQSFNFSARALLLSGPPGIGKTTIIRLISKQKNYQLIEWNASDVRSKLQIENYVKHLQDNTVLRFKDSNLISEGKTIILMDEVDGMTGSDRGGNKSLIDMIKLTKVPIICICNDRNKQSMRTLANYCLDLQFKKPSSDEIFKKLEYICKQENISYDPKELKQQVELCQCDVRQLLNLLQMHKVGLKLHIGKNIGKDSSVTTNIFETARILLSHKDASQLNLGKLMDYYFQDPDMLQFFYHENYLDTKRSPANPISQIAKAAESLADADILNTKVRQQQWGLMPNAGFLATMYPTQILKANVLGKVNFPFNALGKISSENKMKRQILEVKEQFAQQTLLTNTKAIKFSYLEPYAFIVIMSLANQGLSCIDEIVMLLKNYNLNVTQFEEIVVGSLATFPKRDLMSNISDSVRKAFKKAFAEAMDSADQLGKERKAGFVSQVYKKMQKEDDLNEEQNWEEEQEEDDTKPNKNGKQKKETVGKQGKQVGKQKKQQDVKDDKNKQKKKGKK